MTVAANDTPIVIEIGIDDGKGTKARFQVSIDPKYIAAIQKTAILTGQRQGEVIEGILSQFFSLPLGAESKYRLKGR